MATGGVLTLALLYETGLFWVDADNLQCSQQNFSKSVGVRGNKSDKYSSFINELRYTKT